jgi:hypothetical protein
MADLETECLIKSDGVFPGCGCFQDHLPETALIGLAAQLCQHLPSNTLPAQVPGN